MQYVYYLELPLEFPEGIHFGAGSQFNRLSITRDGTGRPVWNGSSIAGWLRAMWRDYLSAQGRTPQDPALAIFGRALGSDGDAIDDWLESGTESCVKVTNCILDSGSSLAIDRMHHLRNRHRGTVLNNGLFEVESCPPGTSARVGIWVRDQGEVVLDEIEEFLSLVISTLDQSQYVGGSSNRGFGRVKLKGPIKLLRFDLANLDQQASYLLANRQWREKGQVTAGPTYSLAQTVFEKVKRLVSAKRTFELILQLKIPRGQDFLIADGIGENDCPEPQSVTAADGRQYWRIPGASLRGQLRSWFHRLAAIEASANNAPVALADSAAAYRQRERAGNYTGDAIGRSFRSSESVIDAQAENQCPIVALFGDLHQPGRFKLSDGLAICSATVPDQTAAESQMRMHVAVDRVTGGAAKGLLFKNRVLTNSKHHRPTFTFCLQIAEPSATELRWLVKSLLALHLGILRVGSSKAAGSLELAAIPNAQGELRSSFEAEFAEAFKNVDPQLTGMRT